MKLKIKRSTLLRWHWRVGLASLLFLLLISVTGIALNHGRFLGLDHINLEAPWLMKAYNMALPEGYVLDISKDKGAIYVETIDGAIVLKDDTLSDIGIKREIARHYRGEGISLEKLMLDIHTGALIGLSGKILSDLVALALIFLSLTGLYNWWKRQKR